MREIGQRRVTETFCGTTEAGEILGVPPSNVWKMLYRAGVESQTLRVGRREMKVALRNDVIRVKKKRDALLRKRERAKAKAKAKVAT